MVSGAPMTNAEAILKVRSLLLARYPDYNRKSNNERVALAAGALRDDFKIREATGRNDGAWVTAILNGVQLGAGYKWCGALVKFVLDVAGVKTPGITAREFASVAEIRQWALAKGIVSRTPGRGYGAFRKSRGVSHVGISIGSLLGFTRSVEGNTSSGEAGSQDDGGGLYGRNRLTSFWDGFIDWNKL